MEAGKIVESEPKEVIRFIGFDKDGTLFNTIPEYTKHWGEIIQRDFGIDKDIARKIFENEAPGKPTVFQLELTLKRGNVSMPKEEIFKKASEIATELSERVSAIPFPEIEETLKNLKKAGYKIFVSSGQQEKVVRKDLEATDLMQYVDFYAGVNPDNPIFIKGEAHFKAAARFFGIPYEQFVKQAVFIGDTVTDLEVAKKAEMVSIIRSGQASNDDFKNADSVVANFSTLLDILKSYSN